MNGGFGMKKDLMRVSNPPKCSICNRIFSIPRDLILHHHAFHSNHHSPTFSSSAAAAAPTTFCQYPKMDLMRVSNPQICSLCNQIFSTPQGLILHHHVLHSNHHFPTFSSSAAAAPTTFQRYPNMNQNPNPMRNRFDVNYNRSGYIDEQGRFHTGFPATTPTPARKSNFVSGQQEKPKLAISSEGPRTLPLIRQLEQRRWQDTVTDNSGTIATSIDLTLRLWH